MADNKIPSKRDMTILKNLIDKYPDEAMELLLDANFWPKNVDISKSVFVRSDDCDGYNTGIGISFGENGLDIGDTYLDFSSVSNMRSFNFHSHRFRSPFGGPQSPRVRKALLILASAINHYSKITVEDAVKDAERK